MQKSKTIAEVDAHLAKEKNWPEELSLLRKILLDCGLTEEWKWRAPCYTFQENNILILHGFKAYCAIGFFKGVLLKDEQGILQKSGANSQSARILSFTSVQEIKEKKTIIQRYVHEAIEIEKAGLKVDFKEKNELELVEELHQKFATDSTFKKAFLALTPGRQRAYNIFFEAAKQPATRITRIEKYTQRILDGKGINDCVCGLSNKMPTCDGSHKKLNVQ